MQKLPIVLLGLGLFLAVGSLLTGWFVFPAFIQYKVSKQVRLEKDGETYKKWENIPIPIFMKIHIFNVTNPHEIQKGGKPVIEEIGPYVYQQKRKKINVAINDNDTIDYQQTIEYFFRPDKSLGTQDDHISVLNLPFVGFSAKAMKKATFARNLAFATINEEFPEESPFMVTTVREFLFEGYHVPFMEHFSTMTGEELLTNNTFGLYFNKNGTTKDTLSVYSGVEDNTKFGNMASFNGEKELEFWNEDKYCNMINGSDGALFPPFVTRNRRLDIFSPELCRSLYLEYDSDVVLQGLNGYRFTLPKTVLDDPRVNDANKCFCTDPGVDMVNCPKQGAYQLESCRKGAPIVVSLPHFLDGDQEYLDGVVGLRPDRNLHETTITLEPTTGVLLEAKKRIQINIAITPNKFLRQLKKMPQVLLPIVWVDESAALTEDSASKIQGKLIKPQEIVGAASWGVFGLGCLLILVSLIIFVARSRKANYKP